MAELSHQLCVSITPIFCESCDFPEPAQSDTLLNLSYMRKWSYILVFLAASFAAVPPFASAQSASLGPHAVVSPAAMGVASDRPSIDLPATGLPRMAPELALQVYTRRAATQTQLIDEYTDRTIVEAELPDTKQQGQYELLRSFKAPNSLSFASVKFTGDSFVKSSVITKLLQSEVDHVEKGDPAKSAINEQNYKISYKGQEEIGNAPVHVFQVKPRKKVPGLFKGKIYIDVYTGSLRRAEGTLAKSPSFFVKKVEFVQDFMDISGVTLPTELRSVSKARIIGRAIVRIFHRSYELKTATIPTPIPTTASVTAPK